MASSRLMNSGRNSRFTAFSPSVAAGIGRPSSPPVAKPTDGSVISREPALEVISSTVCWKCALRPSPSVSAA